MHRLETLWHFQIEKTGNESAGRRPAGEKMLSVKKDVNNKFHVIAANDQQSPGHTSDDLQRFTVLGGLHVPSSCLAQNLSYVGETCYVKDIIQAVP